MWFCYVRFIFLLLRWFLLSACGDDGVFCSVTIVCFGYTNWLLFDVFICGKGLIDSLEFGKNGIPRVAPTLEDALYKN